MTTLDNLRIRKLQLEQHLRQGLSEEQREQIEGELIKIDIALGLLDDPVKTPTGGRAKKPPVEKARQREPAGLNSPHFL
jgi:hypothetical protein